jgi:hypothetical protein
LNGPGSFGQDPKVQETNTKINKWSYDKLKSLYTVNNIEKRQSIE